METSLGTGLKTSIAECVFVVVFESTGGAGFGFTQNSNDFLQREFGRSTELPKGIMLIFKPFEGA